MLLEAEPDLAVAGEAADGSQALDQARRLDPDVILMDVRMPGMNGIEATARLYLSEATVKSHIARILAKLGLRDRVQVAVYAYEQGIVRPGRGA